MKALFTWLTDHIQLKDQGATMGHQVHNIQETLTRAGFEATAARAHGWADGFQVARIERVDRHPNADTLNVCTIVTKDHGTLTVVCGCATVRAGLHVVLAMPGCVLPGQKDPLKGAKLRGVDSQGMLCSATELWVDDLFVDDATAGRIIHVDQTVPLGTAFSALLPEDYVFHVDVTANRGDVGHHYGLARELACLGMGTLIQPDPPTLPQASGMVDVQTDACTHMHLCRVANVHQGTTPPAMRRRLLEMGVKCHFPCVDMTNYWAEDCGQPLHAFDADAIQGTIRVRTSVQGESFHALDDVTYTLPDGAVVIEDDAGLLSLAGIMGGKRASCTPDTRTVILEGAIFDPRVIGRTGRAVAITSQARHRFERGVDPCPVLDRLATAVQWVAHQCGGTVDTVTSYAPTPPARPVIDFDHGLVHKLGNASIDIATTVDRLQRCGAHVMPTENGRLSVQPPTWRYDWHNEPDCVEEVLRLNGYDDVVKVPFCGQPVACARQDYSGTEYSGTPYHMHWKARRFCIAAGLYETVTWSFIDKKMAKAFCPSAIQGTEDMTLANPLSKDLAVMRPSLIPSLMGVYRHHVRFSLPCAPMFEVAPVFWGRNPDQQHHVLGMLVPKNRPKDWHGSCAPTFYDVKGLVDRLMTTLGAEPGTWRAGGPEWMHTYQCAELMVPNRDEPVAWIGAVHPTFDCPVWAAEIMMDRVCINQNRTAYRVPALQPVYKDLSFFVPKDGNVGPVLNAIKAAGGQTLVDLHLVDMFYDATSGQSVTIQATFQPLGHESFTADQLNGLMTTLVQCATQHHWTLRGSL